MDFTVLTWALICIAGVAIGVIIGQKLATGGFGKKHTGMLEVIYDDDFKQELQKMAELKVEKAMQKDFVRFQEILDSTASELGEYIKQEAVKYTKQQIEVLWESVKTAQTDIVSSTKTTLDNLDKSSATAMQELDTNVKRAGESVNAAAIQATTAMGEQVKQSAQEVQKHLATYKEQVATEFEKNIAATVGYYIRKALADVADPDTQTESVLANLEKNKKTLLEDIQV